jgi:hypothetical protein
VHTNIDPARIAVVAVPDADNQQPGEAATTVARMLLAPRSAPYSYITRSKLQFPLAPVFEPPSTDSQAHDAMTTRLAGYRGSPQKSSYRTPRLSTVRSDGTEVDVLEVHWADLSGSASGPIASITAILRLLVQLPDLGRHAIHDAANTHRGSVIWRWLSNAHASAAALLVLPIVLLNAILVCGSLAPAIARKLSSPAAVSISVLWWLFVWAMFHFAFARYDRVREGALWTGHLLFACVFATFVWCLAASSGAHQAVYYAGATIPTGTITALGRVEQATLWTIQLIWVALRALWFLLCFIAIATAVLGAIAIRLQAQGKDSAAFLARRARDRAALRTGRLTLAVPAVSIMLLTVAVWVGGFSYVAAKSHAFQCLTPSIAPLPSILERRVPEPLQFATWLSAPVMPNDSPCPGRPSVLEYFRALSVLSVSGGFVVTLTLVAAALLILMWTATRGVLAMKRSTSDRDNDTVTWLLWIAIFVVPPLFTYGGHVAFALDSLNSAIDTAESLTMLTIRPIAVLAAIAIVVVPIILKRRGSGLDVALGLVNYLRTIPANATPRARIAERYVSLLRELATSGTGDHAGPRYDAVVIVANGLGAAISADLLRFLGHDAELGAARGDGRLTRLRFASDAPGDMPVYLFTTGDLLRRLMNRFFPHAYQWVGETSEEDGTAVEIASHVDDLIEMAALDTRHHYQAILLV